MMIHSIILDQNVHPEDSLDILTPSGVGGSIYQTFHLPDDYVRDEAGPSPLVPSLTGFQLFVSIPSGLEVTTVIDWAFEVFDPTLAAWLSLATGTLAGAQYDGRSWLNMSFTEPLAVHSAWLPAAFRIVITDALNVSFPYTVPNPLGLDQAYLLPGDIPLTDAGRPLSLMFRVMADVADNGIDFLGNVYRSGVTASDAHNVSTVASDQSTFWLSQPSPSHFGVESLYFDLRDDGRASVIDRLTLDPLTPGVYFNIYYSSDPRGPGTTPASWDALLWTPVYKMFQANRAETYALPNPISAQYIKIEFTNLQARAYDPGQFQIPSTFHKYPKWVLDYFLAKFAAQDHDFLSSGVDVTYDALDLAFSYYKGDITQAPDPPALSPNPTTQQLSFFQHENTVDQIDSQTLAQIRIAFQPFMTQPAQLGRLSSILGAYALGNASSNYSSETVTTAVGNTTVVSNLQREPLIVEKGFPVMSFFLPCRHTYRVSQALFEQNIGYFAGVKSLVFHRDIYTGIVDQPQYNEILGDGANLYINDGDQSIPTLRSELLLVPSLLI